MVRAFLCWVCTLAVCAVVWVGIVKFLLTFNN
jgi:hypothetical protein